MAKNEQDIAKLDKLIEIKEALYKIKKGEILGNIEGIVYMNFLESYL